MNIKELLNAIKNDYTDVQGTIYSEHSGSIEIKDALKLLTSEIERLQAFENQVNEKEELECFARELAVKEEGRFSGVKCTEMSSDGVSVEVYHDYWDFSGGTAHYFYTWDELRDKYKIEYPE